MTKANENKVDKPKTERDRRFLEVIDAIMQNENILSDTQMGEAIGEGGYFIYKIRSGSQSARAEHIEKIVIRYKVSANYIFGIPGNKFIDIVDTDEDKLAYVKMLETEVKKLTIENIKLTAAIENYGK